MTLAEFLRMTAQYPRSAQMVMSDLEPITWTELGIDEHGNKLLIVSDRKPVTDGDDNEV